MSFVAFAVSILLGFDCHGAPRAQDEFVARDGATLILHGKPWRFVGYNDWYAASTIPASCTGSKPYSPAELDAEFTRFEASGIGVVRAWFFQALALDGGRLDFSGFERLIDIARAHHIRIVAVMVNGQKDCEPQGRTKTLEWFSKQPGYEDSPLYQSVEPGYILSYRDYAAKLAAHFANEPTVAWWELINEPHPIDNAAHYHCTETLPGGIGATQALRGFADDMAGVVKRVDRNHMLTIGTEGEDASCGQFGGSRFSESYCSAAQQSCDSDFEYVFSGTARVGEQTVPALDLIEIHEYGIYYCNGSRCDENEYRKFLTGLTAADRRHVAEARRLGKPLFYGELGLTADGYQPTASSGPCAFADRYGPQTCPSRADCLGQKLDTLLAPSSEVSGVLYWEATPSVKARHGDCYAVPSDVRNDVDGVFARRR